jgi:DNA-binding GntR family transcriptional regulator
LAGKKSAGEALPTIQRRNLGADVYRILWDRILSRSLNPGQKLSDLRLSEQLGVSRTPVREALHRLVQDGVVRAEPNRGFFVASFSPADVGDIYDVRAALELWSLHSLSNKLNRDELNEQIEAHGRVSVLISAAVSPEDRFNAATRFLEVDMGFHRWLVHQSENRRLISVIEGLWAQTAVFQKAGAHVPGWMETALDQHRMILYLLSQEQQAQAELALEAHIMHMKDRVLADLAPTFDQRPERQ